MRMNSKIRFLLIVVLTFLSLMLLAACNWDFGWWGKPDPIAVSIEIVKHADYSVENDQSFEIGGVFTSQGLVVEIAFENPDTKAITKRTASYDELIIDDSSIDREERDFYEIVITLRSNTEIRTSYWVALGHPTEDPIIGIKVEELPRKLMYYRGETFRPHGLRVSATKKSRRVDNDFQQYRINLGRFNNLAHGVQQIDLELIGDPEIKADFKITVIVQIGRTGGNATNYIKETRILSVPKTVYLTGEPFTSEGISVQVILNGDARFTVDRESFDIDSRNFNTSLTVRTIFVSLKREGNPSEEGRANYNVSVYNLEAIKIDTMPVRKTYAKYESELDLSGLVVLGEYGPVNQRESIVVDHSMLNIDVSNFLADTAAYGQKQINIAFKNASNIRTSFMIEVRPPKAIEVSLPDKTHYSLGEHFSSAGLGVTYIFDNDDRGTVYNAGSYFSALSTSTGTGRQFFSINSAGFNRNEYGSYDISVTLLDYTGFTVSFKVQVVQITSLTVSGYRQYYELGEDFDNTVVVTAKASDATGGAEFVLDSNLYMISFGERPFQANTPEDVGFYTITIILRADTRIRVSYIVNVRVHLNPEHQDKNENNTRPEEDD